MAKLKDLIEHNLVISVLALLLAGFIAGIAVYNGILQISNQETVVKNSYVLKRDLAGTVLRNEAVREIEHLIEQGQNIKDDHDKTRIWLLRTLIFIHQIHLEKDATWKGQIMSTVEADIRWAITDPSVDAQAQKTIGILEGLRSALLTRVSE